MTKLKSTFKKLPTPIYRFLLFFKRNWNILPVSVSFLLNDVPNVSLKEKISIVNQLYITTFLLDSPHTPYEMFTFIKAILSLPPERRGVVVEAGCFKGGSTAKFSLAADIAGRELVIFDSFEGIPKNDELHGKDIFGSSAQFNKGDYCGALEEVKANVMRFGKIKSCRFVKGWFEDTMPDFKEPIAAIYLDVDLASSTRTCLKYLFPLLENGGILYSQDGHLPLVIDVFNDEEFWRKEVGCKKPIIQGLGEEKLIKIVKGA